MDKFDTERQAYYEIFQSSQDGQWYWHLVAGNGQIISVSEGYVTKQHAERSQQRFGELVKTAIVKEQKVID